MVLFRLLICFSIISLISAVGIVNRRREYWLTLSYQEGSTSVVLVNGSLPGPLLEVDLNDVVVVHMTNQLPSTDPISIHFHGMHMLGYPQMDGVPYLTQMPIISGRSFSYVFHANPAGTFFYHSHAGLQAQTAFGPLIVNDPDNPWNASELSVGPLLFSDSWISPDRLTMQYNLLSDDFIWQGEPSYLYINGQRNLQINVDPGKTYLLRLIGATTLSTVAFGIEGHPLTVVEVDGVRTAPVTVNSVEVASGQRIGVTIDTKTDVTRQYRMEIAIRFRPVTNGSNCSAILKYSTVSAVPNDITTLPEPTLQNGTELLNFAYTQNYHALYDNQKMPLGNADQEFYLDNHITLTPTDIGVRLRYAVNNGSLDEHMLSEAPRGIIYDVYNGISSSIPYDVTYFIQKDQIIDAVIQNTVLPSGLCEEHPFHLHGHYFWVHSQGTGQYNAAVNQQPDSTSYAMRDTTQLYATDYADGPEATAGVSPNLGKPCGWTKIRFIANNPGLWLLHCHIGSHAFVGMLVLFAEDVQHMAMTHLAQH
jgi:L-ascorbate oxidase